MIGFFIAGFVCFVLALHMYLNREDTQWHKTVAMIKQVGEFYTNDRYKTDNTLQTVIATVDSLRTEHSKDLVNMQLAHDREIERFRSQVSELSSHVAHLRTENHKTHILISSLNADKGPSQDLEQLKNAADQVINKVTTKPKVVRKSANRIKTRGPRSSASH